MFIAVTFEQQKEMWSHRLSDCAFYKGSFLPHEGAVVDERFEFALVRRLRFRGKHSWTSDL